MIYDLSWLKNESQKRKLKYLYFWGHTSKVRGVIDNSCLSQWYPAPFMLDGVVYTTAEHYMMAQKALIFNDKDSFDKIIKATHPKQAKDLGRQIKNFNEQIWQEKRLEIVTAGNLAKFSQHADLKVYLLDTGERILVEASPVDKIWGVGLAKDDKCICNPNQWRGLNLLGFALMAVRDRLIN